ncbi:helix-turn-helix transcriptional regulator [Bacillus chungangensis]|uniref:AraC-like DNA-binding protein n=1 Tax=Bacillus chungangensis TaxID=587633 RepID=A0ABT9WWZ7_9BACI|nr:AraC family transcriptional regulator [Bacillus chungangensis]MDQ0177749.1 AraC-like DNA-binding protein [Bacillus chungangensis]
MIKELSIDNMHDYFTEMERYLNHEFHEEPINAEQTILLPKEMGKGTIHRTKIREGMEIIISDVELSRNMTLYIHEDCEIFELNYCLSGETICKYNDKQLNIFKPICNVGYFQDTKVHLEKRAHIRSHIVEIRMSPVNLLRYFESEEDQKEIEKVLQQQKGHVKSYPLSPQIKHCVYEILHCPYKAAMKKIYLEAKAMELINLFFLENDPISQFPEAFMHPEDIKKLKWAREVVLDHLDKPYSIKSLANKVGLNENKLKTGFRQLYGTTVFGLIRSQRMEKAAWLMKIQGLNVTETAMALGYSNVSNFTAAFRKYFGYNPSEYLKSMK